MRRFIEPQVPKPEAYRAYLEASYAEGTFTNRGPALRQFEAALQRAFAPAGKEAVVVSSGTTGLVAALQALGVRGLVACPAFTFPATAQAVRLAGCEPLLCDVDPETWELSAATLAPALGRGLAAILHVRTFGLCRDLGEVEEVAARHRVPLVVDAAAALGGHLESGPLAGGQGSCEVFSMHATKPFGIGEGGLVVASPATCERIRTAINFGIDGGDIVLSAGNGKMSEFQAAVGLAVLDDFPRQLQARQAIVRRYNEALGREADVALPHRPGAFPGQVMPVLLPQGRNNAAFVAAAHAAGIETRAYYAPSLNETTLFRPCQADGGAPVSGRLSRRMVCLPSHPSVCEADILSLARLVASFVARPAAPRTGGVRRMGLRQGTSGQLPESG